MQLVAQPRPRVIAAINELLCDAYEEEEQGGVVAAVNVAVDWYGLRGLPRVCFVNRRQMRQKAGDSSTIGLTVTHYSGGKWDGATIYLLHPKVWRGRRHWGEERLRGAIGWVKVALHELGHYILHAHEESHACELENWITHYPKRPHLR